MEGRWQKVSVVPVDPLVALVALLRLERQRGDGPRLQALEGDRLPGLLAIAVGAVLDPRERGIDLGDELALAVAGAKLDGPVGFGGGAVGKVGWFSFSLCRVARVSCASLRMSPFQRISLRLKYSRCRSFMKGSSSVGR